MLEFLIIGCGGFCGALSRYYLSKLVDSGAKLSFPLGLLVINVLGCFLMGVIITLKPESRKLLFLAVGFLGSFTTFSTFGMETVRFVHAGHYSMAMLNVGAHVILGVLATFAGVAIVNYS